MYKEGRDAGIDGSFTINNKTTIIQAKRYKQDYSKLYSTLKNNELPKVIKLNPDRYILGVSMDLQRDQKVEIMNLFKDYIKDSRDILTRNDMNRLLEDPSYKWIELATPKLWLPSINVFYKTLNETVHRAAYRESAEELKDALKTSKVFVPTRVYRNALLKWSQKHVIVLSGEPGVGKTTMAYLLALAYLQPDHLNGFVWANSIEDVYNMLEDDQKQVIILDDFWGSIFHNEHTRRNDENRLNRLLKLIIESIGTKRLILTTREYVLQQGLQKHPVLKETLERYALICSMEEFGPDEKASILFHHLYASDLEYEYVNYLYNKCNRIVYHENYNPRVLALFLHKELDKDCSPETYYDELCNYFDNPSAFWHDIFLALSEEAKIVAMLLLISSTPMRMTDMEICYQKYIHNCSHQTTVKNLGECIAELERTMIKTFYDEEEDSIILRFIMPAVQDFLYSYMEENSDQLIPIVLGCCSFYNQLQFLFEHQSTKCSDRVNHLIIQQCILHYYDYGDCHMEYDGNWNWDSGRDILLQHDRLHRFFHLLRCYEPNKHLELFYFLETTIKDYCITMGKGDLIAQYSDLHNLPDIIIRCVDKGMTFNGVDIITKYYEEAYSIYHLMAIKTFEKVFPEEYSTFYNTNYQKIVREVKNTILSEIELLDGLCMDIELDMLIDNIPDILIEFGLRYTKQFGQKIYSLCDRNPFIEYNENVTHKEQLNQYVDHEKLALEDVIEDAGNWIFGRCEIYLDYDQIAELISTSNLSPTLKEELMQTLDTCSPRYVNDFLQTKESIKLLITALNETETSTVPEQASTLCMIILYNIGRREPEIISKLIHFCAEAFILFMHQDDPVLRINHFITSKIYTNLLKNDTQLCEIVFENLIIKDEQWVRFIHIPLFIFSHAFLIRMDATEKELDSYYKDLWGNNFNKFKYIFRNDRGFSTNMYRLDFGIYHFKQFDWEGYMYRMWEELNPYHFNQQYVEPMIKNHLDKLGTGDIDSKVLEQISLCRLHVEYDLSGISHSCGYELSDELSMIDHLEIADLDVFPKQLTKSKFKSLQKDKEICQKENDKWTLYLYKIKDIEILKEIGVYSEVLNFIKQLEKTHSRLSSGDYWSLERAARST